MLGMERGIICNSIRKIRYRGQHALIDKNATAVNLAAFPARQNVDQAAIAGTKGVAREHHGIFVSNVE
jgi:hypothetical protein